VGFVTIKDVAKEAGVSLGTASRVINNVASVDAKNRARVHAAIEKLGFIPNRSAQSMRKGLSGEIGILVRDFTIPVLGGFVRAVQTVLDEAGYILLISSTENRKNRELDLLGQLSRRRVDGLIMTSASETDDDLVASRERLGFPILFFDRDVHGSSDCVLIDHTEGTRQAVSYLLSLGHRRILLVTGNTETYPAYARIRGYVLAHEAAGITVDPTLIRGGSFESHSALVESSSILDTATSTRPTAIIAGGIDMLPGVLKAVRARGLRIPEDISVIGNSDSDLAMLATPPVTVVKWDYREVGHTSAHLILDRIYKRAPERQRRIVIPTELVIRGSCGPAPTQPGRG
jgi:LacI family transcriptional regulator